MATIFCDPSATGSNNGTSWENAYTSLQAAIDAGAATDEVWVKARSISLSATIDFDNANNIKVYGGFATGLTGTSGSVAGRDLAANITTLNGGSARKIAAITHSVLVDGFDFANGSGGPAGASISGATNTITLSHNKFTHNVGSYMGCDIDIASGSTINIEDSTFHGGSGAAYGGSIASAIAGTLNIKRCAFDGHSVISEGIFLYKAGSGTAYLEDCTFAGGSVVTGFYGSGGAISLMAGTTNILRCRVKDCTTHADAWGGAVKIEGTCSATAVNCIFTNNHAAYGGAILSYGTSFSITNCIVADNHSYADGGGISCYGTTSIANSIFWNNAADGANDQIDNGGATPTVTYSDVQGGYTGTGNVNDDPHFLGGTGSDPYNFGTTTSSAIDSGNAGDTGYPTTDILGQARVDYPGVTNTGACTPNYSDMGAYEM
jgi:hypothetical protein